MPIPFFSDLFDKKTKKFTPDTENLHTSRQSIAELLTNYLQDNAEVCGEFSKPNGDRVKFNTSFVNVDANEEQFVLDSFKPESSHTLLVERQAIAFVLVHLGMRAQFTSTYITSNTGPVLHYFAFPNQIEHVQLRGAFRIHINPKSPLGIKLHHQQSNHLSGQIIDLSATGARLEIAGKLTPPNDTTTIFDKCYLALIDDQMLESAAQLIHWHYNQDNKTTVLGIKFLEMSAATEQKLNAFLTEQQRKIRNPT